MRHLRRVASPDEVRITREPDGETALVEYADETIGGTHFKLGPKLHSMTDEQVLQRFNEMIEAMEEMRRTYKHIATEVPIGQPQIKWFELGQQWCPRGDVLRCVIGSGVDSSEPEIEIDGKHLTWIEFGRLLATHSGWGMRLVFVPDDRLFDKPTIRVRDPDKAKRRRSR
jgi:hypothetical protein